MITTPATWPRTWDRSVTAATHAIRRPQAARTISFTNIAHMPLPPLPEPSASARRDHAGPTLRSNWLVPGVVLASDRSGLEEADNLKALVAAGVNTVVCLQTRAECKAALSYVERARALVGPDAFTFLEFPIVDQSTAPDELLVPFVDELAERVRNGSVVVIHCRGGHGRTGTVSALLLGALYGIDAAEAVRRAQWAHDCRAQPIFCARSARELSGALPGLGECVMLFDEQREQVVRVLGSGVLGSDGPAPAARASSHVYGRGASQYDEAAMCAWREAGEAATDATRSRDWERAAHYFERCTRIRPDWAKGHACLARALLKLDRASEAADVLRAALATEQPTTVMGGGAGEGDADAAARAEMARLLASIEAGDGRGGAQPSAPPSLPPPPPRAPSPEPVATTQPVGRTTPSASPPVRAGGLASLVLLCGPPGAGKTTFCSALEASRPSRCVRVSQDELGGSRRAFEAALAEAVRAAAPPRRQCVLVDRCNASAADRADVLGVAFRPSDAVCVWFDVDAAECARRAAARVGHPTIPYGCGRPAVESMAQQLRRTPPSAREGFAELVVVRSAADADALLARWGARPAEPAPVFKFPRTKHALHTGGYAVSRDDLVMSAAELAPFIDGRTLVLAEEKVDGANLGLSLSSGYEVRAQNRSHFVSPESAPQFRALGAWIDAHAGALCALLEPEHEVLFGEWLYARHSVSYSRLPAYFVAFDLFDKRSNSFVSHDELRERLAAAAGPAIPAVRTVARRTFSSADELLALLDERSAYGDGPVEGVYLRIDSAHGAGVGGRLVTRAKLVRPDFVQTVSEGGHWSSRVLERNTLDPERCHYA